MMPVRALETSPMNQEASQQVTRQIPPPSHIAIIMDGNGRWANSRGMPRAAGHRQGAEALKKLLASLKQFPETKYLTLYAFSSENWGRPEAEVNDLMGLLKFYLQKEARLLHKEQIRLHVIGDLSKLSKELKQQVDRVIEDTKDYDALHLCIALSYGARQELTQAAQSLAQSVLDGTMKVADINEETITSRLYTRDLPAPDLLIRTGGEQRLSNFLLWQVAYAEFFFTPVLWPDFTHEHLKEAIACFCGRERRYGNL